MRRNHYYYSNARIIYNVELLRERVRNNMEGRYHIFFHDDTQVTEWDLDGLTIDLLTDLIVFSEDREDSIKVLETIISQAQNIQLDYEKFLQDNRIVEQGYYKIPLLIKKVEKISSNKLASLLMDTVVRHQGYNTNLYETCKTIIDKSPAFDMTPYLSKVHNVDILVMFLGKIDQVTDKDIASYLLGIAARTNNFDLLALAEQKCSSLTLNYNPALCESLYRKHSDMTRLLLEKKADPNWSEEGRQVPLEIVLGLGCKEVAFKLLLSYGAKISGLTHYIGQAIEILQKEGNYAELDKQLSSFSNEHIAPILKIAFCSDDVELLKLVIKYSQDIDIHWQGKRGDVCYSSSGDHEIDRCMLEIAVAFRHFNIAMFLAKSKAQIGDCPIIALTMQAGNNKLLKALCDNGYDYNQKLPASYNHPNSPQHDVHPLSCPNYEGIMILLDHMNVAELKSVNERILMACINPQVYYKFSAEQRDNIVLKLIEKGLEFAESDQNQALIIACKSGLVRLVNYFAEKGFDLNIKQAAERGPEEDSSLIKLALSNKHNGVISVLLKYQVSLDEDFLIYAISQDIRNDLIAQMAEQIPDLHYCNYSGENALHHAAQKGNKEIFDLLISKGMNPRQLDKRGNDVYSHALYHGHHEQLAIASDHFPFSLDVYAVMSEYVSELIKEKNLAHVYGKTIQGEYAAKLACLFDNKAQAAAYVEKHGTGFWPLHDLTIFSFPAGEYNKQAWRELAMENGLKLTKYLFLAAKIELKFGRSPESMEEVILFSHAFEYNRASENPAMSDIFHRNAIAEHTFNRVLDSYKEKTEDFVPEIYIDGSEFAQDRFYMKKLAKDDLRGFILGNKTNCCQHVGAEGNDCATHGMTSAYGGFYVVFKKPKEGTIANLSSYLLHLEGAESEQGFLDLLTPKAVKQKYAKIIQEHKKIFEIANESEPDFAFVKEKLKQGFQEELEGEIVAQSWVWISQNNNLVLDSWERLRDEDDMLFAPFMKELSEQLLIPGSKISKIMIGAADYGNTPYLGVNNTDELEVPQDYKSYRDSTKQYLIAKRPSSILRTNPALDIEDKDRISEIEEHFSNVDFMDRKVDNIHLDHLESSQQNWIERCQFRQEGVLAVLKS